MFTVANAVVKLMLLILLLLSSASLLLVHQDALELVNNTSWAFSLVVFESSRFWYRRIFTEAVGNFPTCC